jgi:hypothetical protein
MPDFAVNSGIASFLQNFSKHLLTNYEQEKQKQNEINKLNTERTAHAINTNRIMYQPQNPVPAPLSLSGEPTGIGQYFPKPDLPSIGQIAPELPKTQPLTLQQQNEVLAATRQGQPLASRYITTQPEIPTGEPIKVTINEKGDINREWGNGNNKSLKGLLFSDNKGNLFRPGTDKAMTLKEIESTDLSNYDVKPLKSDADSISESTFAREEGKNKAKAMKEFIDSKSTVTTNNNIINTLLEKNKNTYNGKLQSVLGYKTKQVTGLGTKDPKFQNTAYVVQELKSMVAKVLKSTFGGQLSDSEREYLNSVYGAAADYTQEERRIAIEGIKRMFDNKLTEKKIAYSEWTGEGKTVNNSQGQEDPLGIR